VSGTHVRTLTECGECHAPVSYPVGSRRDLIVLRRYPRSVPQWIPASLVGESRYCPIVPAWGRTCRLGWRADVPHRQNDADANAIHARPGVVAVTDAYVIAVVVTESGKAPGRSTTFASPLADGCAPRSLSEGSLRSSSHRSAHPPRLAASAPSGRVGPDSRLGLPANLDTRRLDGIDGSHGIPYTALSPDSSNRTAGDQHIAWISPVDQSRYTPRASFARGHRPDPHSPHPGQVCIHERPNTPPLSTLIGTPMIPRRSAADCDPHSRRDPGQNAASPQRFRV